VADKNFKVKSGLNIPIASAAILTTDSNGNVSSTAVLPITAGGTGQTSATNAINALLPVQNGGTVNYAIQSDGTNINWGKLYNQGIKNNGTTITPRGIINIVGASFTDDSGTDTTTLTLNPAIKTIDEKTANYVVQTSDNNKILEVNSSSGTTITIPTNTLDSIPNGTTISLVNKGTGSVTFAGSTSSLPLSENTTTQGSFLDVAFGNGLFIGITSGGIYSSTDGINWTLRSTQSTILSIKFLQNKFYVGTNNGIVSSSDGISWTTVYSLSGIAIRDIDYGNGKFIAAAQSSRIVISNDGISWTLVTGITANATQIFFAIIYVGSDTWYMSSSGNPFFIKSIDHGSTWSTITTTGSAFNASSYATTLYFNGTRLLAKISGNTQIPSRYSSDGIAWSSISGIPLTGNLTSTYSHTYVVDGSTFYLLLNGTNADPLTAYLYSSTDLSTWTLNTTLSLSTSSTLAKRGAISDSGTLLWLSGNKTKSYTTGTESSIIESLDSSKTVSKRYAKVDLYKYNSNNWVLTGDLDSKTVDVELNSEQYYNLMGVF
jgi:hypothetical protein